MNNHRYPAAESHRDRSANAHVSGQAREVRAGEMLTSPRTLSSRQLFLGAHEIGIEHEGALYRLKITRQGKLILNK